MMSAVLKALNRPWLRNGLVFVTCLYCAAFAAAAIYQDDLIFNAWRGHQPPQALGLRDFSEERVTMDEDSLVVWSKPAQPGKPTFLFFHGVGGGLAVRLPELSFWAHDGAGVIAVEYPGFGASTGSPSEEGVKKTTLVAYDFARAHGVAARDIFVVGESLGTGAAIWLASQRDIGALLLDSPYSSVGDVAIGRYWFFPVRLVLRTYFPARDWIGAVKAPILAIHGTDDDIIPVRYARALMAAAPSERTTYREVEGASHIVMTRGAGAALARHWVASLRNAQPQER